MKTKRLEVVNKNKQTNKQTLRAKRGSNATREIAVNTPRWSVLGQDDVGDEQSP